MKKRKAGIFKRPEITIELEIDGEIDLTEQVKLSGIHSKLEMYSLIGEISTLPYKVFYRKESKPDPRLK